MTTMMMRFNLLHRATTRRAYTQFTLPLYQSHISKSRVALFSSNDDSTTRTPSDSTTAAAPPQEEAPAAQHEEWVKFQQSISVAGFETGQSTTIQTGKKKNRGARKKKLNEEQAKILERQRLTQAGGGEYPPMRYSEEETRRLLEQAYAAIPPRAGKRGTRNLKRQERRWQLVRDIRQKYKEHMAAFQERKMQERSRKIREVKAILSEAPAIREKDRAYQLAVYQRWASTMKVGPYAPKMLGGGMEAVPSNSRE